MISSFGLLQNIIATNLPAEKIKIIITSMKQFSVETKHFSKEYIFS